MINVEEVKKKILTIINERGPSLPVPIARQISLSPVFSSAILAELVDEQRVVLSKLRVGSSPLYLIPGQEQKLEEFSNELSGVEKSAYLKLKQAKILEDENQEPAIRVALRSIKDFAIPLRYQDRIIWRYAFANNEEVQEILDKKHTRIAHTEQTREPEQKTIHTEPAHTHKEEVLPKTEEKLIEPIFDKTEKHTTKTPKIKQEKKSMNFLEEIKSFLTQKNIEILNTIEIKKDEISAKIKINEKEHLLIAYNKKRIAEKDILKAYKKAANLNLPYYILSKGIPTKKMKETIDAYKKLREIDIIE